MHDDHHHDQDQDADRLIGHNRPAAGVAQWQTPHLPKGAQSPAADAPEPDFDLVEASFVEGFAAASDPTSFLRLAGVPFRARDDQGRALCLLRVQRDETTDVGAVAPYLGGSGYRYDPLPAKLVSKRRRLHFIYHDGEALHELTFAAARALDKEEDGG
jgi:hypothetical protein